MNSIVRISDAAIIAIHTIEYLVQTERDSISAGEIAEALNVSYNHLSKVIQHLKKNGYMKTIRGPSGGYSLTPKGKNAKIKDIIALFEGKNLYTACFLTSKVCDRRNCVLKDFLTKVIEEFNKMGETKIIDMKKLKND